MRFPSAPPRIAAEKGLVLRSAGTRVARAASPAKAPWPSFDRLKTREGQAQDDNGSGLLGEDGTQFLERLGL